VDNKFSTLDHVAKAVIALNGPVVTVRQLILETDDFKSIWCYIIISVIYHIIYVQAAVSYLSCIGHIELK